MSLKEIIRAWIVLVLLGGTSASGFSQDGKYGRDSVNCVKNLSLYKEYEKQNAYTDALKPWTYVFSECPGASRNIFIDGVKIFSALIEETKDPARKNHLVDTLMLIYDRRIQYFGQEGFVLGRKGVDLLRYRKEDAGTAYEYLESSVKERQNASEEAVVITYMQTTVYLFANGKKTREEVMDNFSTAMAILQAKLENTTETEKVDKIKTAIEAVEKHFSSSGAADCPSLVKFFTPKYEQTPEDPALLKKMLELMDRTGCNEEDLFVKASASLHKLEPSARSAYILAKMFIKRKEAAKAVQYYNEAVSLETDGAKKAQYLLELSVVYLSQSEPEKARTTANRCLELDKNIGMAYIVIGKAYASTVNACGSNDFEKAAVYWAVVDKFIQARTVDPSVSDEAGQLIGTYSRSFPNREEAFFYGINEGDSYSVGCWIGEKTRARFR